MQICALTRPGRSGSSSASKPSSSPGRPSSTGTRRCGTSRSSAGTIQAPRLTSPTATAPTSTSLTQSFSLTSQARLCRAPRARPRPASKQLQRKESKHRRQSRPSLKRCLQRRKLALVGLASRLAMMELGKSRASSCYRALMMFSSVSKQTSA